MNVNVNLMEINIYEIHVYEKDYIWHCSKCICENGKYLASIMDDSTIICDEVIEEIKTIRTNFNEKKVNCKTQFSFILLAFLLITIALLIAVSICYLIKYPAKHLLPFHDTNNKLNNIV